MAISQRTIRAEGTARESNPSADAGRVDGFGTFGDDEAGEVTAPV
ncbi:hypothetical protein GCM10009670_02750 [Citricoccus alkalitolerans]